MATLANVRSAFFAQSSRPFDAELRPFAACACNVLMRLKKNCIKLQPFWIKFYLPKFEEEIGARNVEIRPACTHTPSITEGSRAASSSDSQDNISLPRSTLALLDYRDVVVSRRFAAVWLAFRAETTSFKVDRIQKCPSSLLHCAPCSRSYLSLAGRAMSAHG